MLSDTHTGSLLRTLTRSKANGHILEIGTGTGLGLSWIIDGMDDQSTVISIDNDESYQAVARAFFEAESRVEFVCEDGEKWIQANRERKFDIIFADAWPGKYSLLDTTLAMLKKGGLYLIDDMLPQPNWPDGHSENVRKLMDELELRQDITLTKMDWSTGLVLIAKK